VGATGSTGVADTDVADTDVAEMDTAATALAEVRDRLATVYERLHQPTEAVGQLDAIVDELTDPDHRSVVATAAHRAGRILAKARQHEQAADHFDHAADLWAELGQPLAELDNRRRQAAELTQGQRFDEALAMLSEADALADRLSGDPTALKDIARLDVHAQSILWAAERDTDALRRADRAVERSLAVGMPVWAAHSRLLQARILLGHGQPEAAEAAVRHGLELLPAEADRGPFEQVLRATRQTTGHSDSSQEAS
jgi:tetratricopeptide (TPR) repeat protein